MESDNRMPSDSVDFKQIQIIVGALILGPLAFAAIAIVMAWQKQPSEPFLAYFGAAFAVVAAVASVVVPNLIGPQVAAQLPAELAADPIARHFAVYKTKYIVRDALVEGAAFFNIVAYMSVAQKWSLGVVLALLALMILTFPTRSGFDSYVQTRPDGSSAQS